MPSMGVRELADEIAEGLPPVVDLRTALVAIGIVTSSLLLDADISREEREQLAESFCKILRGSIAPSHH